MKKILFFALLWTITTACGQTKESYLDEFKIFVENVQKNAKDYTKTEWKETDKQFAKLKNNYDKFSEQMTSDEKNEIVKLESTYAALKLKKFGANLKESAKDVFQKTKDTVKDVAKNVKKGTQKAVKKGAKAMEGFKEGMKD